jgi:hypothetical protein
MLGGYRRTCSQTRKAENETCSFAVAAMQSCLHDQMEWPGDESMNSLPLQQTLPLRRLSCARCGATFDCGTGGAKGNCWCADEAARVPMPAAANEDCLCPACLRALIASGPRPA